VQCLAIVNENSPEIDKLKSALDLDDADFEQWLKEEHQFLQELRDEPEVKILKCAYVRALETRQKAE